MLATPSVEALPTATVSCLASAGALRHPSVREHCTFERNALTRIRRQNQNLPTAVSGSSRPLKRVTDNLELYVEPSATVYSKKIEPYTPHPAEGELKLSVSAKVHF